MEVRIVNKNSIFVGFIPRQIEANREDEYGACLAGFPVNIYFARVPEAHNGNPLQPTSVCYYYDPLTFEEDGESKRMAYRISRILAKFDAILLVAEYS